jgi:predicted acetyltransferase
MPAEIRIPREEDREDIARLLSTSLNFPLERAMARKDTFNLNDLRSAYVDGRLVANAAEFKFTQWFGGRGLATSGIWGVATEPEHRGMGYASACLGSILDDARRRGDALSALFPAVLDPYRKSGYELAGTFDAHRIALKDLPATSTATSTEGLPRVELAVVDRDLDPLVAAYAAWVRRHNGGMEPNADFWRTRVLNRPLDETARAVVIRDDGAVIGFVAFTRVSDPTGHLGEIDFGLRCSLFFMTEERALRAFIAYLRGYQGVGTWLQWSGSPNDPLTLLVGTQAVTVGQRYRWMLRILDVPSAFEGRGYPAIDAEATFAVDDPRYHENAGPWRLTVSGGEAKIEHADRHDRRAIPIGTLSSMFTGYLRPADAVVLGSMDSDDPAVEALSAMLDGADPWCPFFF